MSEQAIEPNRGAPGEAAAATVVSDPTDAKLLARHAQGDKTLTAQENGRIGWIKSRLKNLFPGKPGDNGGQAQRPADARQSAPVASVAPGEAALEGVADLPSDPDLVRRTTGAVLARVENFAARKMDSAVLGLEGVPGQTVARLRNAARLPADDKTLLIDLSPDVAASCGLNPRHYPLFVFAGVLGLWATDLWLAIDEVKKLAAKQRSEKLHEENKTEKVIPVKQ